MILLVDNYDSFTFNVYQALVRLQPDVLVERNDARSAAQFLALEPSALVLGPGPGRPSAAGATPALLGAAPPELPILGICLGHQALIEHWGGRIEVHEAPMHGRSSLAHHREALLLEGLPNPFEAGRYHSLRAVREDVPAPLRVTAWSDDGTVMAVQHSSLPQHGVQFHPESILSPDGDRLFENFVRSVGEREAAGLG